MLIRRSSKNIWRSIAKWNHMHKPQNGCFPTFLFCDLTGIRRRQELSFMPPLNFGEELKQRGIAWTKIADRQVKYSCQISEEIGRPCRWRKSDVPSACFNPWRQKTQRCLWRDLDQSKEPDVWEFLRYVFGGGGVVTDHSVHSMHGRSMQMATKQGTLSQLKR